MSPASSASAARYSAADVALHSTPHDCWIIVDDFVYDVSSFMASHPGGPVIETYAGIDATDVFTAMHPAYATAMLDAYRIGFLDRPNATAFQREYRELRKSFVARGLFDSDKLFYARVIAISTGLLALALLCFLQPAGAVATRALGALALALFWQQNGWISHDFLHYSVCRTRFRNWVLPWLYGAVGAGYTYIWWSRKHNAHHAAPNVVDADPDIDTMPVLAWSQRNIERKGPLGALARAWIRHQHLAFLPLLAFARFSWTVQSGLTVFESSGGDAQRVSPADTKQTTLAAIDYHVWRREGSPFAWRRVEGTGQLIYWAWTLTLFFGTMPFGEALTWYTITQLLSGVLLALPFVLNHSGMEVFVEGSTGKWSFFELQARSGRNISPSPLVDWFCGGLNYQIEHHLYPRMPRHSHAIVAPEVRALCAKHGVPYHSVGFADGVVEVYRHLRAVGATVDMVHAKVN